MNDLSKARATWLEVGEESAAQRIDNFLLRRLKGVPKSHVYRGLHSGEVRRADVAVVNAVLDKTTLEIRAPLRKYVSAKGERRVSVGEGGREAVTRVKALKSGRDCSVLEVRLLTGRTHQIRVHLAHAGHPILGDDKYGDFSLNHALAKQGVRRLFLHARLLEFAHPISGEHVELEAKLPDDMRAFVEQP